MSGAGVNIIFEDKGNSVFHKVFSEDKKVNWLDKCWRSHLRSVVINLK